MPVPGKLHPMVLLIGGTLLFIVTFQIAERFVGPPERSPAGSAAETSNTTSEPISIEIDRPGPQHMRIKVDGIHTSSVRLDAEDDGSIDELIACITAGIEQAKKDGVINPHPPDGWLARKAEGIRISEQISQIQHQCFSDRLGLPPLPPLPPAPAEPTSAGGAP